MSATSQEQSGRGAAANKLETSGAAAGASFAQQRLWFLDQLEPGLPVYNVGHRFWLTGDLNRPALEAALNHVLLRHAVLRTTFRNDGGVPVQVVNDSCPVELRELSLRHIPAGDRIAEAVRITEEEFCRPFDLARDLMLRAMLLKVDAQHHLLTITVHHIAFDAWSLTVFKQEFSAAYTACIEGRALELGPLPMQYSDFSRWQRERLSGAKLKRHLDYWRGNLDGIPGMLPLPSNRIRSPRPRYRGDHVSFSLTTGCAEEMQRLAARERTTPFVAHLAVIATLLHRYTSEDDIVIGAAVAGRTRLGCEPLIGFFINMLPLRADLSGNPTFRELMTRLRMVVLEAIDHQDLPFEKLVEELNPGRDMSRNPLFQVAFTFINVPQRPMELPGLTVIEEPGDTGSAKFDWTFRTSPAAAAESSFGYDRDLYDRPDMIRTTGHWTTLLGDAAANPERRLSDLKMLTSSERRRVLLALQTPPQPYPAESVQQVIAQRVASTPGAVAVEWSGGSLTYAELDLMSGAVATRLAEFGVGPGQYVAICGERSPYLIAALAGILKTGAAYLPLDLKAPMQRRLDTISESGATALLAPAQELGSFAAAGIPALAIESAVEPAGPGSRFEPVPVSPESPACVLYTSGSTGRPKGAIVPHKGILRLLFGGGFATFDSNTAFLQIAPLAFDASTLEIWGAILHGGRCVILEDPVPTPQAIGAALKRHSANTMWITSSLFNAIIDEDPKLLAPLRLLMTGGEVLSVPQVRRALRELPDTHLINGYGPTENTTFTTCYSVPRDLPDDVLSIPIGRPIANTTVYLLDPHINPVPEGVDGEICVGGDGVALGYLNQPELTARSFIENPLPDIAGQRLYRTGDYARWRPDGLLHFVGRRDGQVKIRGFRIELGEIEAVLETHPGVAQAVAGIWEPQPGNKALAAWVAGVDGSGEEPALRDYLRDRLPEYMVPAAIQFVPSLPRNASGKVDRASLPRPAIEIHEEPRSAPADVIETRVLEVWNGVLARQDLSVAVDFFEAGGDSLTAVRFVTRLEEVFGIRPELAWFFTHSTVSGVASFIKQRQPAEVSRIQAIQPTGHRPPIYLLMPSPLFHPLAARLAPDQPFFGLAWWDWKNLLAPVTIEQLAERHVEALRTANLDGPLVLAGWCLSGLIAYESACLLRRAGVDVAAVVLFDCVVPEPPSEGMFGRPARLVRRVTRRTLFHARRLASGRPVHRWPYLLARLAGVVEHLRDHWRRRKYRRVPARQAINPEAGQESLVVLEATRSYQPRSSDFKVIVVVPEDSPSHAAGPSLGWDSICPENTIIVRAPGDHRTMFNEENAGNLAAALNERLETGMASGANEDHFRSA